MNARYRSRSDDFCLIHGYDRMVSVAGNPIPFCEACEEQDAAERADNGRNTGGKSYVRPKQPQGDEHGKG